MGNNFYGVELENRMMLGTGRYPSPEILAQSFRASGAQVATVSLRREIGNEKAGQPFWDMVKELGVRILPNTAGCTNVKEAVTTSHMAREMFDTKWIKLEVMAGGDKLLPDPFGTVEAAKILLDDGFEVFPYITEDLTVAERLLEIGCKVLMPWGAPIGSGLGLNNKFGLRAMRAQFPDVAMVVDAGIGLPSHAVSAMEMGFDAVLLNTAVAKSGNPPVMAKAFSDAVAVGHAAALAVPMEPRQYATPSTPHTGMADLK